MALPEDDEDSLPKSKKKRSKQRRISLFDIISIKGSTTLGVHSPAFEVSSPRPTCMSVPPAMVRALYFYIQIYLYGFLGLPEPTWHRRDWRQRARARKRLSGSWTSSHAVDVQTVQQQVRPNERVLLQALADPHPPVRQREHAEEEIKEEGVERQRPEQGESQATQQRRTGTRSAPASPWVATTPNRTVPSPAVRGMDKTAQYQCLVKVKEKTIKAMEVSNCGQHRSGMTPRQADSGNSTRLTST